MTLDKLIASLHVLRHENPHLGNRQVEPYVKDGDTFDELEIEGVYPINKGAPCTYLRLKYVEMEYHE